MWIAWTSLSISRLLMNHSVGGYGGKLGWNSRVCGGMQIIGYLGIDKGDFNKTGGAKWNDGRSPNRCASGCTAN
jgi:hypothetical protein